MAFEGVAAVGAKVLAQKGKFLAAALGAASVLLGERGCERVQRSSCLAACEVVCDAVSADAARASFDAALAGECAPLDD